MTLNDSTFTSYCMQNDHKHRRSCKNVSSHLNPFLNNSLTLPTTHQLDLYAVNTPYESKTWIGKNTCDFMSEELEQFQFANGCISGMTTHDRGSHGGNVSPKHFCTLLSELTPSIVNSMEGFCDIGCGFGNPNIIFSRNFPHKISVGIDIDALRVTALKGRLVNHGIPSTSINAIHMDFITGWCSDELSVLHCKKILYFMNNFNFTELNYSFLQFFKEYAGAGSLVLCYERLWRCGNASSFLSKWPKTPRS